MGAMKRLNYRFRTQGERMSSAEELLYGVRAPRPSQEELDARAEAAREARLEREAIQAVEREAEAEALAARPKVFAPDAPDFPRSRVVSPEPPPADHVGLASPLTYGDMATRDRRSLARVLAGEIGPGLAELRSRAEPKPPMVNTGWYQWGDGYCRIGSTPFPEYRYPGLSWRLHWTHPKPDDVPWEDEAADLVVEPPPPPPVAAPRQHAPSRRTAAARQASFAW